MNPYKYILARLTTKMVKGVAEINLSDSTDKWTGEPENMRFDSKEEALEYAKNNTEWKYVDFTILEVYYISGFEEA